MSPGTGKQGDIEGLIIQMQAAGNSTASLPQEEKARVLQAARRLVTTLETPQNALVTMAKWPVGHAALRFAMKVKLFEQVGPGRATAEELAYRCNLEHLLLVRILRVLVCMGIFEEVAKETYIHNELSKPLSAAPARAMIMGMAETTDIMPKLPEYLASLDFRNPHDRHNALFNYANETDLNMYQWLQQRPEKMAIFNDFQSANAELNDGSVQQILASLLAAPNSHRKLSGSSGDKNDQQPLLVDVGGGRGESLRKFRRSRPELKGRLIIQDLPNTVEDQALEGGVEAMPYDFFTPQPVEGANIYFFRYIFHNWPDSACQEILTNTRIAMSPTSRLVICDLLLPEIKATAFETFMDIQMMAFAGMERTESQWRALLAGAGLKIMSLKRPEVGALVPECLIEAEVEGQ